MIEWKPTTDVTPVPQPQGCLCCEHVLAGTPIGYVNDRDGKLLVACNEHCLDYSTTNLTSATLSDWLANLRDLKDQGKLQSIPRARPRRDTGTHTVRFDVAKLKISALPVIRETGLQRRLRSGTAH